MNSPRSNTQPNPTEETPLVVPPEIPQFFRLGPIMLIFGSFCIVITLIILTQALRWDSFKDGLAVEGFMALFLAIPLFIIVVVIQGTLALIFMSKKRRAWWRTTIVILPSILMILGLLYDVTNLYPHERRARNALVNHLGGPLPDSIQNISLSFTGGIDPGWVFSFEISPADYEKIKGYRDYRTQGSGTLQHHDSSHSQFYYLDYNPSTRRCKFQSLDY